MKIWVIIAGMAIVTYGTRLLPLTTIDENVLPLWVRRGLKYVPIAVLSAIIGPSYITSAEWGSFDTGIPLIAGIIAIVAAYFTRNIFLTIVIGMVAYIVLRAL